MFAHLNPHSSVFGDICALSSPFSHHLPMYVVRASYALVQATVGAGTLLIWDSCVAYTGGGGQKGVCRYGSSLPDPLSCGGEVAASFPQDPHTAVCRTQGVVVPGCKHSRGCCGVQGSCAALPSPATPWPAHRAPFVAWLSKRAQVDAVCMQERHHCHGTARWESDVCVAKVVKHGTSAQPRDALVGGPSSC